MADSRADGSPGDEPVEVVDQWGNVVEIVTRRRMRSERLRHRCTYVAVIEGPPDLAVGTRLDLEARLVIHQRADWKDTYPSFWDVAFGGVCGVGEPWLASARRELAEEAGIEGAVLHDLGPTSYDDTDNQIVGRLYVTAWPTAPICLDGEVVALDHVRLGDLAPWLESTQVCPDSAAAVVPALLALVD